MLKDTAVKGFAEVVERIATCPACGITISYESIDAFQSTENTIYYTAYYRCLQCRHEFEVRYLTIVKES